MISMRSSLMDSLVDSFFECKKANVKQRLRDSMEAIVDDLFGELVGQVKHMMTGVEAEQTAMPSPVIEQPKELSAFIMESAKPKSPKLSRKLLKAKSTVPSSSIQSNGIKRPHESVAVSSMVSLSDPLNNTSDTFESSFQAKKPRIDTEEVDQFTDCQDIESDMDNAVDSKPMDPDNQTLAKFICSSPGCGKRFKKSCNLKDHQRTHSGSKPYLCKYPGCSFADKKRSNALRHIRTVHLKNSLDIEATDQPNDYLEVNEELRM